MYLPLQFLESVDNYILLKNASYMEKFINNKSMQIIKNRGKENNIIDMAETLAYFNGRTITNKTAKDKLHSINKAYSRGLNVACGDDIDFIEYVLKVQVRNEWRDNKFVYNLDRDLLGALINMKLPEHYPLDIVIKTPVDCFFIDFNGETSICEDMKGAFVDILKTEYGIYILILGVIDSGGKCLTTRTMLKIPFDQYEEDMLLALPKEIEEKERDLYFEDGKYRRLSECKIKHFIYNFMAYLYSVNGSTIEENEETKRTYRKRAEGEEPKNKFREVQKFDVGFRKGRSVKPRKVYNNTDDEDTNIDNNSEKDKRKIVSHYRQAHWHHYWKGSGKDKKLILKWVEGTFVKGSRESDAVVVHDMKLF